MASWPATRSQIDRLLNPRSVAVIGASEDQGKFGGRVFHMLQRHGFAGELYPVNPRRETLLGLKAYPSVGATPRPPDLAVMAVPRALVRPSVEACVAAGVGAAVIITAQFAEVGDLGAEEERALVEIARAGGMRLLGPNCLGFISPVNRVVCTSSPALDIDHLRVGEVALVSQSGALMATIFDRANDLGIGFSHCISVGNQADLEAADFVEYLIDDPRTRAITSYIEGFKYPARVIELADRARAAGKPWLMVKAGRTASGERAALSHTASLAGSYAVLEAVARDHGIVLMDDPDAMVLAAATMARFAVRPVRRVAIVTTSGGGGAIAADRLTDQGVELTRFAPETARRLDDDFMPGQAGNPVDLGGRREGEAVDVATGTLKAVAADPGVDLTLIALTTAPALATTTANLAGAAAASGQPYLFVMWPGTAADASRQRLLDLGAPFCDRLGDAVSAVRAWTEWSADEARPRSAPEPAGAPAVATLDHAAGPVGEAETKRLLAAYGVPVNAGRLVESADAAVQAAVELGFPVALKIAWPNVVHKSDAGGVALALGDAAAVRTAWASVAAAVERHTGAAVEAMLVQAMVPAGVELIVGVKRDPQFGPVVVVGAGGSLVELLRDVAMALAPVGPAGALRLLRRLKVWPLLAGTRGRPALDVEAAADAISRVSRLAHDHRARLAELDVNPLIVAERGVVAVDARAVLDG